VASRRQLLTSGELAAIFRVDRKTITRWTLEGRIPSIRTPGGQHRFRPEDVRALLAERDSDQAAGK
jgi:excisionase family DNA binding protein